MIQGCKSAGNKRLSGNRGALSRHCSSARGAFGLMGLLTLCLLLSACSNPVTAVDTGSLQVTIEGLPADAKAEVLVNGPEGYRQSVTNTRTLTLRSGTYTLTVDTVTFAGESFTGRVATTARASTVVDVAVGEAVGVDISYSSVGQVGAGSIAPGITRSGAVSQNSFDDYTFGGTLNVPLVFDFTGTGEESNGAYIVSISSMGAPDQPLVNERFTTYGLEGLLGFSPPAAGMYLLRIRGAGERVDYRVRESYLNGPPEARGARALELNGTAIGTVTSGSYDLYRFAGTAGETVVLDFSTDNEDRRYNGFYTVSLYRVGEEVPVESFPQPPRVSYGSLSPDPEISFAPSQTGDYLVRVTGVGEAGSSLVRYSFVLRRPQ